MTFRENLAVLRDHWVVVFVTVVLAMGAAAAVWALRPVQYTASLTLYVSAQTADTPQTAYQGGLLAQQRVKSYIELISSVRVSEQVVADLRLPLTPEQVAAKIDATSTPDSVLIDVGVTDPSAREATAIANGVSAAFVRLVDELERPATAGAVPPVAVRVVRPASVPSRPSSPDLPVMLALGLLGGLVLGAGAAVARHLLDTTVKSAEQLGELAGAPNLTTVGYDGAVRKRPLTVHEPPDAPRAEAFRRLRTNLRFVDVDNHHKVIVVTSPLPADGKTTTTLNLAIALASGGQKVLVVEADLRRPGAAKLLGLACSVGLTSVLSDGVGLDQAIQPWAGGVDLLASGPLPPNPAELLASRHMAALLAEVRPWYDTVLIDTPPLLPVTDAAAVAPAADGVLLVTRFRKTSRDQVAAAVAAIAAVSVPLLGTVFNMVPRRGPRAYARYHAYYASRPSPDPAPAPTAPREAPLPAVGAPARTGAHTKPEPAPVNGSRPAASRGSSNGYTGREAAADRQRSSNGRTEYDVAPDRRRSSNGRSGQDPAPVPRSSSEGWSGVEPATPAHGSASVSEWGSGAEPVMSAHWSASVSAGSGAEPVTPAHRSAGVSEWRSDAEPKTPAQGLASVSEWRSDAEPVTPSHRSVSVSEGSYEAEPVTPPHGTSSSAWFAGRPSSAAAPESQRAAVALRPSPTPRTAPSPTRREP